MNDQMIFDFECTSHRVDHVEQLLHFAGKNGSAQRHATVISAHLDRVGMRYDSAHLGAHAFDKHKVVGRAARLEDSPGSRADPVYTIGRVVRCGIDQLTDACNEAVRLVASNGPPPPAFVRIQDIHGSRA